jgi:hypothetical protein
LLDEGRIERGRNKEVEEPQILKFHLEEIFGFQKSYGPTVITG